MRVPAVFRFQVRGVSGQVYPIYAESIHTFFSSSAVNPIIMSTVTSSSGSAGHFYQFPLGLYKPVDIAQNIGNGFIGIAYVLIDQKRRITR